MSQNERTNPQDLKIQQIVGGFLRRRAPRDAYSLKSEHLDEDSFNAFVEGNVSEREARPILSHLVDCSFCRNVTAELIKLDYAFAEDEIRISETSNAPVKVSEVLGNLLSRIFGQNDAAVFAHQESEEEIDKTKNITDEKK